jgi:Zn-dependent protease with chaperone function
VGQSSKFLRSPFGILVVSAAAGAGLWLTSAAVRAPGAVATLETMAVLAWLPGAIVAAFLGLALVGGVGRIPLVAAWWLALLVATALSAALCVAPLALLLGPSVVTGSQPVQGPLVLALVIGSVISCVWGPLILVRLLTLKRQDAQVDRARLLPVSAATAPALFQLIRDVCTALAVPVPPTVMLARSLDFYVTRDSGERILVLSAPAMTLLTVAEFAGIVGHELSHLRSGDLAFGAPFVRLYRRFQFAVGEFENVPNVMRSFDEMPRALRWLLYPVKWSDANAVAVVQLLLMLVAMPIVWLFRLALGTFAVCERHHARQREFAADRTGAAVCGRAPFVSGLVKVHAAAPLWADFVRGRAVAIDARLGLSGLVQSFNKSAARADHLLFPRTPGEADRARRTFAELEAERESLVALLERARGDLRAAINLEAFSAHTRRHMNGSLALLNVSQPHPLDSHPSLHQRLAAVAGGNVLQVVEGVLFAGPSGAVEAHLPLSESPF